MFRLHERTQRRVCRVAFFACCFAPLIGIVLWAISKHAPSQRRDMAERLASELGLAVEIKRVSFPRPGEFTCGDVTLRPNSGGPTFATIQEINIAPLRDSEGNVWRLAGVRTRVASLKTVASALWHATSLGGDSDYAIVDHWTITPPKHESDLPPLHIANFRLRSALTSDDGISVRQIRMQFQQSNTSGNASLGLEVSRESMNRNEPEFSFEFNTGDTALPCWAFRSWFPATENLGSAACFRGKGRISMHGHGSDVALSGKLIDIDFSHAMELLAAGTAHATGTITLDSLRLRDGELESAHGAIHCTSGVIDRRLVDAAVRALYCVRDDPSHQAEKTDSPSNRSSQERFDELACRFSIDSAGMTLWGTCQSAEPKTIIARDGRSLLYEPRYRVLPVANLVYLVVPQAPQYVPATREAQAIAKRLPFPSTASATVVRQADHTQDDQSEKTGRR